MIELANAFIKSTSRKAHPKLLKPAPGAMEGEVTIVQWRMLSHEAKGIATIIRSKIASGEVKPEETLVLTPRKQIGYEISNHLNSVGIKAQTCFSDAVLKGNKKAQEGYAYLSLLHNRNDAVSLRVLLGIATNDRGRKPYERVRKHCFESGDTVTGALSKLQAGHLHIPYTDALVARYKTINQKLEALSSMALPAIIDDIFPDGIDEVAEIRKIVLSAHEEAEDIHELFNLVNTEIIQPELPVANDSVLVLTLHKAKGLTARMVVIANCLEGCIPYIDDYTSEQEKQNALAEQERLFFVALTRTTNILVISSTAIMRRGDVARLSVMPGAGSYWSETQPSRFISMLGPDAPAPIIGEDYIRQKSSTLFLHFLPSYSKQQFDPRRKIPIVVGFNL